jgi:hypothetical protein
MFDNKFFLLFVTLLWMSGLFAALLTVAHMLQERGKQWPNEDYSWGMPRILAPLYASLATFCAGLALHAYAAQKPVSPWITLVWALLAFFLLVRMVSVLFIGLRYGWSTRLNARLVMMDAINYAEEGRRLPVWSSTIFLLLLVNFGLLGWWGSTRINADVLTQKLSGTEQIEDNPTPPQAGANVEQPRAEASVVAIQSNEPVAITGTANASAEPTSVGQVALPTRQVSEAVLPTPIPTATPAPINTPLPAVKPPKATITVRSSKGANVRSAPNLAADVIAVLDDATVAPVLGRNGDSADEWFMIALPDGQTGWISILVAEPNDAVSKSPVVAQE